MNILDCRIYSYKHYKMYYKIDDYNLYGNCILIGDDGINDKHGHHNKLLRINECEIMPLLYINSYNKIYEYDMFLDSKNRRQIIVYSTARLAWGYYLDNKFISIGRIRNRIKVIGNIYEGCIDGYDE